MNFKSFLALGLVAVAHAACPEPNLCSTALPSSIQLVPDTELPDPFKFLNGTNVTTKQDWQCRREEVKELFQRYELGTKPAKPTVVAASYSNNSLAITCTEGNSSIRFNVSIAYPSTRARRYPAIIAFDGLSIPAPDQVAIITFNVDEMAAQNDPSSRGQGLFYDLYGANATASALTAWAWGVSRIIDALEITTKAHINTAKIGVTGCSRNGKGALVAGAFDDRIALTIPQESGSGGSACWRLSDASFAAGDVVQTAHEIVTENVWFSTEFATFANDTALLPFDHHMLAGLVAPRGLYVTENSDYEWLGPWSSEGCMEAGRLIYKALGVRDNLGFSLVGNHSHCLFPATQAPELTAFVNKFLLDEKADTNIFRSDLNGTFPLGQWVDWSGVRLD